MPLHPAGTFTTPRMDNLIILETKRLILRQLLPSDWPEACRLLQDPAVMYAYEGPFSDQEVQNWLDKQWVRYRRDGFGLWAVIEKSTAEQIGQCGLTYQEYAGRQVPEVGYLLRQAFWHKGYATEAACACRDYAFYTCGFETVYSIIRDTNQASRQVAIRCGMKPADALVKFYRGVRMPHVVYKVEKREREVGLRI